MRWTLLSFTASCVAALGVTLPASGETIINVPPDVAPASIGSDTQLNLVFPGSIPNYFDAGAADGSSENVEVNISGGSVGYFFEAHSGSTLNISGGTVFHRFHANSGSTVNISGGTMGYVFGAYDGSTVNISGGTVRNFFGAYDGSTVNISGGTVGAFFGAYDGSTVNISGGTVRNFFHANSGSSVNISGGSVGRLTAYDGSTVNLFGTDFLLDGAAMGGLANVGDSLVLGDRGGAVLGVTLRDGRQRDFVLNDGFVDDSDWFDADATLRLTLSDPFLLSDLTRDEFVDFEDLTTLLANWNKDVTAAEGNLVEPLTTVVNFADLTVLLADWTGPGPAGSPEAALGEVVPEPSTLLLALLATLGLSFYRRRRRRAF